VLGVIDTVQNGAEGDVGKIIRMSLVEIREILKRGGNMEPLLRKELVKILKNMPRSSSLVLSQDKYILFRARKELEQFTFQHELSSVRWVEEIVPKRRFAEFVNAICGYLVMHRSNYLLVVENPGDLTISASYEV